MENKRFIIPAVCLLVLGASSVCIIVFTHSRHISTDDAFIEGHPYRSAQGFRAHIKGNIGDNQQVKKGICFRIDPRDYEVRKKNAEANLEATRQRQARR